MILFYFFQEKSASELVDLLVQNSSTFETKTEFSQEKYIKKKKKKYVTEVFFLSPTLQNIVETIFEKDPKKISYLRSDTISQILTFGNIRAGSRVLIVENVGGLIVGACLSRMGGYGVILNGYDQPK
jgi:tRNA (adenine-N(1)-)-methyltransferase non-catalytic subunit